MTDCVIKYPKGRCVLKDCNLGDPRVSKELERIAEGARQGLWSSYPVTVDFVDDASADAGQEPEDEWDREIAADAAAGRLDGLRDEALDALKRGDVTDIVAERHGLDLTTLDQCLDKIDAMIVRGDIGGNGCDKTAERNGIILAFNALHRMREDEALARSDENAVVVETSGPDLRDPCSHCGERDHSQWKCPERA